jgi:hypothetical protein
MSHIDGHYYRRSDNSTANPCYQSGKSCHVRTNQQIREAVATPHSLGVLGPDPLYGCSIAGALDCPQEASKRQQQRMGIFTVWSPFVGIGQRRRAGQTRLRGEHYRDVDRTSPSAAINM